MRREKGKNQELSSGYKIERVKDQEHDKKN